MLRWLTAGESHGQQLTAILEGLPAGVEVQTDGRRRCSWPAAGSATAGAPACRSSRTRSRLIGGVRHGRTQGGPIAIAVGNTEWPKWQTVMSADPVDAEVLAGQARNAPLTRPRPGHADLAGMQKYGFDDARPVLERASARETAARVALGAVAAGVPAAGPRRRGGQPRRRDRAGAACPTASCPGPHDNARDRRGPGALRRPGDERARWSPRSTTSGRTATPSAASSRSSSTACRRGWAATCTGTAGWTPGWPAR